MVKKLAALGLLSHTPYHGAELTPAGEVLARRAIRRRDLIARYLIRFLDYSAGEAGAEAEQLEHVISEKLEGRLAASLGNASLDEVRSALRSSVDVIGTRRGGAAQGRERS
jgi:DtxR family Mn-dependent transcriptional regulator